jgi:hypothetical protein
MIETKTQQPCISLMIHDTPDEDVELSRLLAAAVINLEFCHLLLENPELALETGFQGETFCLNKEEYDLVSSIRADSLADLAGQLARTFDKHLHIHADRPVQPADPFGY